MKKIVLGLLLTAGISGLSYGNNIKCETENSLQNESSIFLEKDNDTNLLQTCIIVTEYRYKDSRGKTVMSITSEPVEASGDVCNGSYVVYNVITINI